MFKITIDCNGESLTVVDVINILNEEKAEKEHSYDDCGK
jgi:hypothetical protein